MNRFDITTFGAIGDGTTLNTPALRAAAEACRDAGGGTVVVPPGTFLTGTFELFGSTVFRVEKGGRLLASPRLEDHRVGNASCGLLFARDAADIVLTGEGILDGNAEAFFVPGQLHGTPGNPPASWQARRGLPYGTALADDGPIRSPGRPGNMLVFARCRNLRIENLILTGATYWTVHCADCDGVEIDALRIANDPRHPNNDGIHVTTCRAVRIARCHISGGDDAVAITGFSHPGGEAEIALGLSGLAGTCEDVEVSDCVLSSRSSAVRVGYGTNPVRRVRLRRLDIRDSNRGLCIHARQSAVDDVTMESCRIHTRLFHGDWWGRGEPIHLSTVRFAPGSPVFPIRDVILRDIEADGEGPVTLFAEEPGAIERVELVRVNSRLRHGPLSDAWGGNLDLRPAADPALGIVSGGRAPLWAVGVAGLHCAECRWETDPSEAGLSPEPVVLAAFAGPA